MRAGLLTERILFKKLVTTTSQSGAVKKEYVPDYSCRAYRRKVNRISDKDGVNAKEQFFGYTIEFQVRYNPLIKETHRIEYQGKEYRIIPPLEKQKDNTYIITVTKIDE